MGTPIRLCLYLCHALLLTKATAIHPAVARLESLLQSLNGLTSYYNSHYADVNLDGIFGALILRNSIRDLLLTARMLPEPIMRQLSEQLNTINSFLGSALNAVKNRNEDYFEKLGPILQLPWISKSVMFGPIDSFYLERQAPVNVFPRDVSDRCLTELFRSNLTAQRCLLSPSCKTALLSGFPKGYDATRLLIYLSVADQLSCTQLLNTQLIDYGQSVGHLQNTLCSSIYLELLGIFNGNASTLYPQRDLILEQVYVCGYLGFGKFLKLGLLDTIISWQHRSGCFAGDLNPAQSADGGKSQKLPVEERLDDGCLTHMTSVATAALSVYLNYFLRPSEMNFEYGDVLPRIIAAHYAGLDNPHLPPLLEDQPQQVILNKKSEWQPGVQIDLVSKLGQIHGLGYHFNLQVKTWSLSPFERNSSMTYLTVAFFALFLLLLCSFLRRRSSW